MWMRKVVTKLAITRDGRQIEAIHIETEEGGMLKICRCEDKKWIRIPVQDVKETLPLNK